MKLAIIGGSGLYDIPELQNAKEVEVETPFGAPSGKILTGRISELEVLFLPRHGKGHKLLPGEINYKANIYALKKLGAGWVLSVSACGSLAEDIAPGDFVLPNQFLDFTQGRQRSFFGDGICAHVQFASPVSSVLSNAVSDMLDKERVHRRGTYVCIEGPTFATRAESAMYRSLGGTIIGMTNLPEARLAREAQLAYSTLGLVTDYDSWRSESDDVDVPQILKILSQSLKDVKGMLPELCLKLKELKPEEEISSALSQGILTSKSNVPAETLKKLEIILGNSMND